MTKDIIWLYTVEKWSTTDIAKRFCVSANTVRNFLKKHKIKLRTPQEGQALKKNNFHYIDLPVDEIVELYTVQKWKTSKIAAKYFVHESTILKRLHSRGIETPKPKGIESKLKNIDLDKAVKLYFENGLKLKDIAKSLNCCESTLRKFAMKHNVRFKRMNFIPEEAIIDLYVNQLFTVQEIADVYGVSSPTISKVLKNNGVKIRGKRKNINENNQQGTTQNNSENA